MLTRFEKARIIGARALQIAMGAPVLSVAAQSLKDPYNVAEKEFDDKALPLTVVRELPNGEQIEISTA